MPQPQWSLADAPSLQGRTAVVTGATGGLGFETALGLAQLGATVILAARNPAKGSAALADLASRVPGARLRFALLDLADLASVAGFAQSLDAEGEPLDILVNNAGVMALQPREVTRQGFERQFGTNYLGHFALTAQLMPLLLQAARPARVVQLASLAHRQGHIDFDDLQGERHYHPWTAYRQSKLAMLMFALELAARAAAKGWPLISVAAHPGWAFTDIISNGPGSRQGRLRTFAMNAVFRLLGQSAKAGALPILFAATAPEAESGGYYGPLGSDREIKGPVGPSTISPQARDPEARRRLWETSEALTRTAKSRP